MNPILSAAKQLRMSRVITEGSSARSKTFTADHLSTVLGTKGDRQIKIKVGDSIYNISSIENAADCINLVADDT